MFTFLLNHIKKFIPLTTNEEQIILNSFNYKKIKKKELVLKEGSICYANYFIIKGCCRMFLITDEGKEQTIQFAIENWWMSDYTSFENGKPSNFNIQAIEATEIAWIEKQKQEELFKSIPQLERYFRIIMQRAFSASLMRINYIYTFSGEERYRHFNKLFPAFVQRVPQIILASYLGFTPEFLSKIRAKRI